MNARPRGADDGDQTLPIDPPGAVILRVAHDVGGASNASAMRVVAPAKAGAYASTADLVVRALRLVVEVSNRQIPWHNSVFGHRGRGDMYATVGGGDMGLHVAGLID